MEILFFSKGSFVAKGKKETVEFQNSTKKLIDKISGLVVSEKNLCTSHKSIIIKEKTAEALDWIVDETGVEVGKLINDALEAYGITKAHDEYLAFLAKSSKKQTSHNEELVVEDNVNQLGSGSVDNSIE